MKKILVYLLSISLLFISCGNDKKNDTEKEEDTGKWFMAQTDIAPVANVSATSELVEAQFAGNYLYPPVNIVDGDLDSTWCEADENGSGIGEVLTIEFIEPVSFDEIQIVNGFAHSAHPDYYLKNNRVKQIKLTQVAGEHFQCKSYVLKDECPDWQSINFELTQTAQFVTIEIEDIYPGNKYDDTCFDDIRFLYQGNVIPFKGVKELKTIQEENSKEMLNSDFEDNFKKIFKNGVVYLRKKGSDSGIKIEENSGSNYYFNDGLLFAGNTLYENEDWNTTYAKLGNCRLIVSYVVGYVEVEAVKIIRLNGKVVYINGVEYEIINPDNFEIE